MSARPAGVPVSSGPLSQLNCSPQFGKDGFKGGDDSLDALAFRPHFQQRLLKIKIERQGTRPMKGYLLEFFR